MAWRLPDGKTIQSPKAFTHDGVQHSAQIFLTWSTEELAAIGVQPFREEKYDTKWYKSLGYQDTAIDGEIVRTHTTIEKFDNAQAAEQKIDTIRKHYMSEMRRANEMADFYDAVGDSDTKKVWTDYASALKTDAKTIKDAVEAAGSYDEIIHFPPKDQDGNPLFKWTQAPDTLVVEEVPI